VIKPKKGLWKVYGEELERKRRTTILDRIIFQTLALAKLHVQATPIDVPSRLT